MSLLGPVRLERAYDPCAECGHGSCPWDGELGVTGMTLSPGAAEVACIAGVQTSCAEASVKVLPKRAELHLAESTVERSTEVAGERLAATQASGDASAPGPAWAWHRDREGKTVAYVAVAATGVAQQGRRGGEPLSGVGILHGKRQLHRYSQRVICCSARPGLRFKAAPREAVLIHQRHQNGDPTPAKHTHQAQLGGPPHAGGGRVVGRQRQEGALGNPLLCQPADAEHPQRGDGHGQPQPGRPLGIGHAGALPLPSPTLSDLKALLNPCS